MSEILDQPSGPLLFLSHVAEDRESARRLRRSLESEGYRVFMAPDDVRGSTPWQQQIADAVARCDVLVVLISEQSTGSQHVQREVSLAISSNTPILPVRLEQVELSGSLAYLLQLSQWLDAFPPPVDRYSHELARRLADLIADAADRPVPAPPADKEHASHRATVPWQERLARPAVLVPAGVLVGAVTLFVVFSGVLGGGDDDPNQDPPTTVAVTTMATTSTTSMTNTTVAAPEPYGRYRDDTNKLMVDAPTDWDFHGGSATIGGEPIGPGLTVSSDISAFRDEADWATPGVFVFASRVLLDQYGTADAYLNSLSAYEPCEEVERRPYLDAKYTGVADYYFGCGDAGVGAFKLVAVPTDDPDYLIAVLYKGPVGDDAELRGKILDTFNYSGDFDWSP